MDFGEFDTETLNRPGGGYAVLLVKRVGPAVDFLEFPRRWDQIWKFLRGGKYVCWNMDFDARAIVHDEFLPYTAVSRLALYGYAEWRGWRFHYIPGKCLEVGREGETEKLELYDLAGFYGMSLAAAGTKFLPRARRKKSIPRAWYSQMDRCLLDKRRARILDYARADVESLGGLKDILLDSLRGAKLELRRLSSPASVAVAAFGGAMSAQRLPDWTNRIWRKAFYGGRVEIGSLGLVRGARLYDIHSAYPSELAKLEGVYGQVLRSEWGQWTDTRARYGCYFVGVEVPKSWRWGPVAVRQGETVVYPVGRFNTWIARPALDRLRALPDVRLKIWRAWELAGDGKTLFPDMGRYYAMRKDPRVSLAVKLAMNSAYGKLAEAVNHSIEDATNGRPVGAQHIRTWESFGRYANFVLASEITERVRLKLWDVLRAAGDRAHYAATDGVILDGTETPPTGPDMGEWDLKSELDRAVILGCGRYVLYPRGARTPETHLRGFGVSNSVLPRLRAAKRRSVLLSVLEADTLRAWAGGACVGDLNVLRHVKRRLTVEDDKRHWTESPARIGDCWRGRWPSEPLILWEREPKARRPSCVEEPAAL